MEYVIVAIYDDLKKKYISFELHENEEVAKRQFKGLVKNSQEIKENAENFALFKLGLYNANTGVIVPQNILLLEANNVE